MTLDEIRKLCEGATPGPIIEKHFENGSCLLTATESDARFIAAARTLLPALLEVAEKAQTLAEDAYNVDDQLSKDVFDALAALEALKL